MENMNSEYKEIEFYKCSICGNIVVKLNDSGITPQCCSKMMIKMSADDFDGDIEKHLPDWHIEDEKLTVKIGSKPHPMEEDHHIEWILVKTNKGFHVKFLSPNDMPEACFKLCNDEKVTYIYSHCNVHGLWKARVDKTN